MTDVNSDNAEGEAPYNPSTDDGEAPPDSSSLRDYHKRVEDAGIQLLEDDNARRKWIFRFSLGLACVCILCLIVAGARVILFGLPSNNPPSTTIILSLFAALSASPLLLVRLLIHHLFPPSSSERELKKTQDFRSL